MIRRLFPDRVAVWMGIMAIVVLVVAQAVSVGIFLLLRPSYLQSFSADWLVEQTRAASDRVFSAPAEMREAVIAELNASDWLYVELRREPPAAPRDEEPPPIRALRAALLQQLEVPGREIRVGLMPPLPLPGLFGPPPRPPVRHVPPERDPGRLPSGPPSIGPDRPLPGLFEIGLRGDDNIWLIVTSREAIDHRYRMPLAFASTFLGVGLAAALVAWLAARRVIRPLAQLTAAARRIGINQDVVDVPERGPEEFRAITRAFNEMQTRLKKLVDNRTQMVAAMSHDLRTPLARLRLRAEYIHEAEQQKKMLGDLTEIEAMVEASLAFATQDSYREARQAVDVAALLQGICEAIGDTARWASYEGPRHLVYPCQPLALRSALTNLIDNACKHGDRAQVTLSREPGGVCVVVRDDGPGIPEDEQEKVFTPFYRLERSRNRGTGGTGLGLTLARSIARAHGGDVVLSNGVPRGLVAALTLPHIGPPSAGAPPKN